MATILVRRVKLVCFRFIRFSWPVVASSGPLLTQWLFAVRPPVSLSASEPRADDQAHADRRAGEQRLVKARVGVRGGEIMVGQSNSRLPERQRVSLTRLNVPVPVLG